MGYYKQRIHDLETEVDGLRAERDALQEEVTLLRETIRAQHNNVVSGRCDAKRAWEVVAAIEGEAA